ncbi:MAG: phenylalanine--tRNA ligase subunit beta [Nitrospinota bacterium]|nr:MAG: phenylalanine--tRNA ligase subunit beta [Nitrospinota bacterium]
MSQAILTGEGMKISYRWLQEFVSLELSPSTLADRLTMAGLEVKHIEETQGRFSGVVVGKIESIRQHPQADKLSLCQVTTGTSRLSILCGATNIAAGHVVPVALPGARLPGGRLIQQATIRGEVSEGMLCSPQELELGEDADGIMLLPADLPLGKDLGEAIGLWDTILELDLTPNRPDCLSMLGVAREVAALTGQPLRLPPFTLSEGEKGVEEYTSVSIEAPDHCPRYAARVITGITLRPSPLWMQIRLLLLGLRPINNVVDVTNYVMMELGQPLHAFDYERLEEHRIVVRLARPGEHCTTLDGVERSLTPSMLVIADAQRAVAVAGVMGGLDTEVTPETRHVLLESAYFSPLSIRRTAKALDLHTEASHRFERGADIEGSIRALDRAAALIQQVAGGVIARGRADCYPRPFSPRRLTLRVSRTNRVLGTRLTGSQIASYLQRLHLPVTEEAPETYQVTVPSFRPDLEREIDLIEEVARLHGYEQIDSSLPQGAMTLAHPEKGRDQIARAKEALTACGFYEVITYSFINPQALDRLRCPADDPLRQGLRLRNPLSKEASMMRTTLIPGLLETVSYNLKREQQDLAFFEYGRVFFPQAEAALPREVPRLAAILSGKPRKFHWSQKEEAARSFYDIKGAVEAVCEKLGIDEVEYVPTTVPYLHPYQAATLRRGGEELGILGAVHPDVLTAFDIPEPTWLFELDFEKLCAGVSTVSRFQPLPRFPSLYRDIAVVVEHRLPADELRKAIIAAGGPFLRAVSLFDVYTGPGVPAGKKSVAFSLVFRADDRTLTDEEVNRVYADIVTHLHQAFHATLRGE